MGRLEFIFPLLFIVLGSCNASDCDHMALNVCQNLIKDVHQALGANDVAEACEKSRASIDCFQDFVDRCYEGEEREEQFSALTSGLTNMENICQNNPVSPEQLQCLQNELQSLQKGGGPCADDMRASQQLQGEPADEESVKKACCAFMRYQTCWKNTITKKCGELTYTYATADSPDMTEVQTNCKKFDCSGSGLISVLPVWLMTGLVALQVLMSQQ